MSPITDVAALPAVPVGTVVCFAGDASNSQVISDLYSAGWLPCDPKLEMVASYPKLFGAIGHAFGGEQDAKGQFIRFYKPNFDDQVHHYGSLFARGVNGTAKIPNTDQSVDPDSATRQSAQIYGNVGNDVGSIQQSATGLPQAQFTTDVQGEHTHAVPHTTNQSHYAYDGTTFSICRHEGGSPATTINGAHAHDVSAGGDAETRPASVALWHIIKFTDR